VRLRLGTPEDAPSRVVVLEPSSFRINRLPSGRRLGSDLGYVDLPELLGGESRYAERALEVIRSVDSPAVCGWVVDLRRNGGGDMRPMFAGLRPILGEGTLGFFIFGERRVAWSHAAGSAPPPLHRKDPAVAVLTSALTGSAGEATAIAFRGRRWARSFGEPTAGLTTTTFPYLLPDGALLVLATGLEADRTGRVFPGRIEPEQPVPIDWRRIESEDDPMLATASAWLREQPPC
jgi:C-terminal processing protease CtpA/Prc